MTTPVIGRPIVILFFCFRRPGSGPLCSGPLLAWVFGRSCCGRPSPVGNSFLGVLAPQKARKAPVIRLLLSYSSGLLLPHGTSSVSLTRRDSGVMALGACCPPSAVHRAWLAVPVEQPDANRLFNLFTLFSRPDGAGAPYYCLQLLPEHCYCCLTDADCFANTANTGTGGASSTSPMASSSSSSPLESD